MAAVLVALLLPVTAGATPDARPRKLTPIVAKQRTTGKQTDPKRIGANARVAFNHAGELRPMKDSVMGRRAEPLTAEEEAAAQIQKLLRSPLLRRGVTGLYVADAKSGQPLFAVNADDPLNPASNVKLISTATALDLLGADFRYPTRILGPAPQNGVVKGDLYLLGSYDPTLSIADMHELADTLAAQGITAVEGNIVVGADPTRDGIYRAIVPIDIVAGEPGQPPTVTTPMGFDLVQLKVTATTSKKPHRARLTYKTELTQTPEGQPRIVLSIGGAIGKDAHLEYPLWTRQRTATAAYTLVSALRARAIGFTGELEVKELGDFVGDSISRGYLPVELARHESDTVGNIVTRINKWSINWLADRLVMTAAGLAKHQPPSMDLALGEMYAWLDRHPHLDKKNVVVDTGSGLSYRTQITPTDLVSIVRSAGGFTGDADPDTAKAWLHSLAVAGTDGTLQHRFRNTGLSGHIVGKTGSLSTVIALTGVLEVDPSRPLVFSLVTNSDAPLVKKMVRRAHEQVIAEVARYLEKTSSKLSPPVTPISPAAAITPPTDLPDEPEESTTDKALDAETANHD
ncbi:MAG TPA: D-alanyl-D-alanine carboxypeptidase [Kofleriaceae bacterium]|nr:D-alanyl-D-alanine carboxypeptidase [Kofleriaceae bacterium]